jgi:hypothetical protein
VPRQSEIDHFATWGIHWRDLAREAALPPERHALLRQQIIAWGRLTRAGGRVHRPRFATLYSFLETAAEPELLELSELISETEGKIVQARQQAKAGKAERKYERQAKHVEAGEAHDKRERRLRGTWVWLYHGTSSALLDQIVRDGLSPDQAPIDKETTTPGFVYLTAQPGSWGDGGSAAFYARRAAARHGGEPIVLRVIVDFDDLEPDDDDADQSFATYNAQFRTRERVPPGAIMEIDGERLRERYDEG